MLTYYPVQPPETFWVFYFGSQDKPKHPGPTFSTIVEKPLLFQ
jgi:hypothetical protein